jgi:glycerol uptake facilitator-like aquaporin
MSSKSNNNQFSVEIQGRNFVNHQKTSLMSQSRSNSNIMNSGIEQYNQKYVGQESCPVPKNNCPPKIEKLVGNLKLEKNCWRWIFATALAELIAVFILLFVGGAVIASLVASPLQMIAGSIAFGFALLGALIVTSPWHTHANPTVTLMLYFFESPETRDLWYVLFRIIGQFAGGFLAMWMLYIIFGQLGAQFDDISTVVDPLSQGFTVGEAFLMETIGSFILHLTVLVVSVFGSMMINAKAFRFKKALIIGFVFLALEFAGWRVTGAAYNHARWLPAAAVTGVFAPIVSGSWWIYPVGPIVGALLAGLFMVLMMLLKNAIFYRPEAVTK